MWSEIIKVSLRWIFFTGIIALSPVIFKLMLLYISNNSGNNNLTKIWLESLVDGELFIFASTISAISIDTMIFNNSNQTIISSLNFIPYVSEILEIIKVISLILLVMVFASSIFMFGYICSTKRMKIDIDQKTLIAKIAITLGLSALFFGYIIFIINSKI